jgi:hypothetical protein
VPASSSDEAGIVQYNVCRRESGTSIEPARSCCFCRDVNRLRNATAADL